VKTRAVTELLDARQRDPDSAEDRGAGALGPVEPEDFRALTPLLMAVYRSVPAGAPFKASNDAEQRPKAPPKHRGETTCSLPKLTLMRKSAVSSAIAGSS
jgi:hypothetical protein